MAGPGGAGQCLSIRAPASENWANEARSKTLCRMSSAVHSQSPDAFPAGAVRVADSIEIALHLSEAESAGFLPVLLSGPAPAWRGQLALRIEEAIEDSLGRRGACSPGVGAASSLEQSLSDQLYRARLLELRGLALGLPSLAGMASISKVLDAEDSAVLRWWLDTTGRAPVLLVLDRSNADLGVYGPPRSLAELLQTREPVAVHSEGTRALVPEVRDSVLAMELSSPPPAVVERDGALAFEQPYDDLDQDQTLPRVVGPAAPPEQPANPHGMGAVGDIAQAILQTLAEKHPDRTGPGNAAPGPVPAKPVAPPLYPNAPQEWRSWASDLSSARGARPLAAIERMFVSSYVPLSDAVLRGIADADAEALLARWAASFARSYEEAFDALRMRGKRPTMVLDVQEIALRIGRLHGARSVQLLLIDALRFDLGLRVEQRVRALAGQHATLAERLLLWSAIPTTTETQLELIGRGPEGLSEPIRGQSFEVSVARGRAATALRRVKAGHRELLKLDIVEARLSEPGASELERLDVIADETAQIVSDHLAKQPPRTLVLAFGDHGFLFDSLDDTATSAARQGGASPEEVLVPAFAWLVGGLH